MHFTMQSLPSPIGDMMIAWDGDSILRVLDFTDYRPDGDTCHTR